LNRAERGRKDAFFTGEYPFLGNGRPRQYLKFTKMAFCLARDAGAISLLTSSLNSKAFGTFRI
jgi:hypothetical protein